MTAIQPVNVPQPVKLTIEQFRMLDDTGAFCGYSKTELIDGAIYAMNSQYAAHAVAKTRLARRLGNALEALGSPLEPVVEGTLAMPPNSAPEPDIALARVSAEERAYIPLQAVALVIEISDASIAFDLNEKALLYASQGIAEYWVLDVAGAALHQLWEPTPRGFEQGRTTPLGVKIASVTMPELAVETSNLV